MSEVSKPIARLQQLLRSKPTHFQKSEIMDDYNFWIELRTKSRVWQIFIQDEYHDFSPDTPLMAIWLVFDALEEYKESEDFLVWCRGYGLDPSNSKLLQYYKSLGQTLAEIEKTYGTIDSWITPMEYQLRTGVIQELLDPKNQIKYE
ncbi:hypothetical protein [Algoriphagus sediminis]|uniref:DUF4274 domain-containing protein n=1 Tax=Algoriphagus sediminis TaxID=3057113 RepID=A0ABT7YHA3_9BACT|nr:hypothetical protein [Algoriphagus sediminis]MDN3205922.1 hypothetical protein [Algoriphagus sediminis]